MSEIGNKTLETMSSAKWYNRWLFSLMKKHIGKEILEVGVGIGNFTGFLSQVGKVTAIDIDQKYIKKLQKRLGSSNVGKGDIENNTYFFRGKKFDCVVCLNVLEHIKADKKALRNIYSLLNEGGKLILLVPAHKLLYSKFDKKLGHFRRYTKIEIDMKLKEAGFKNIHIRYLNWWAAAGWLFFMKLLKSKEMPKSPVAIFDSFGKLLLLPEKILPPPFGLSVYAIAQKK